MLRPAGSADLEALIPLIRRYYAEDAYPFSETEARAALRRLLGDRSLGRVWMAFDADMAVGYLVLTLGYSLEYRGRDAFVDELYVLPSHRRRGLGSEALALAEAACREEGVRALHLEVERHKDGAQGLYRRSGFVDHQRTLMTKRLSSE